MKETEVGTIHTVKETCDSWVEKQEWRTQITNLPITHYQNKVM